MALGAYYYQNTWRNRLCIDNKKCVFLSHLISFFGEQAGMEGGEWLCRVCQSNPQLAIFLVFPALASEASFMFPEERYARKELYEVPGGNL
eukprot:3686740-Pyramimonas_sp.AAC.1